jgi:transposase
MPAQSKKRKVEFKDVPKLNNLEQINLNAAGLDIGAAEIWACVPEGRDESSVRVFETYTVDLHRLADWLAHCGVETVAMESTGVYWIPVYEILEARGFEVYLVNARHVKNVSGRKSDVLDCQWIQQLHTYGLLKASFRPEADMCALRAYVRHRDNLIRYRSAHIQHMQKALQQMNVQLTNVISDITGVTGMKIIRAIVAGEHDPVKLAQFRDPRCKSSEAEIAKALTGHYQAEHLFALQQALELYDFYNQQIKACDREIEQKYAAFEPVIDVEAQPLPPAPHRRKRARAYQPDFDLRTYLYQMCGVDLTRIDGLDALTVQQIITETGLDMSPWPTVKHFASWLSLAPHNKVSGGKVLKRSTQKSKNRAAQAFRLAARSVSRSNTALGAFYRRMRAKHGGPKAITATAHKIARIFYLMLKYRQAYRDPGQDYYEQKYQERVIKNLKRKAKQFGMDLVPLESVS